MGKAYGSPMGTEAPSHATDRPYPHEADPATRTRLLKVVLAAENTVKGALKPNDHTLTEAAPDTSPSVFRAADLIRNRATQIEEAVDSPPKYQERTRMMAAALRAKK